MMGGTQEDELLQPAPPAMARPLGVEAGAAGHEAAHAVADYDQILDVDRPRGDERFERLGEGAAVDRDVQAGIVGEIDRRIAEIPGERRAVVVVLAHPLQVAHAESVREHGDLAGRFGDRLAERALVEDKRAPGAAKPHGQRQRIGGVSKIIANDAVERGERGFPPARDWPLRRVRTDKRRGAAERFACQPERAAHAAVNQPRDAAGQPLAKGARPGVSRTDM